jgi:hypothetical protein
MRVDGSGQERLAGQHDVAGLGSADLLDHGDAACRERDRVSRRPAVIGQDEIGDESQGRSVITGDVTP